MYREQDHQRCSEKQCNWCLGGFAPIKGWERGVGFPGSPFVFEYSAEVPQTSLLDAQRRGPDGYVPTKKEGGWETDARGVSSRMLHDVQFPCARNVSQEHNDGVARLLAVCDAFLQVARSRVKVVPLAL